MLTVKSLKTFRYADYRPQLPQIVLVEGINYTSKNVSEHILKAAIELGNAEEVIGDIESVVEEIETPISEVEETKTKSYQDMESSFILPDKISTARKKNRSRRG